jgi:hypothetical protein
MISPSHKVPHFTFESLTCLERALVEGALVREDPTLSLFQTGTQKLHYLLKSHSYPHSCGCHFHYV